VAYKPSSQCSTAALSKPTQVALDLLQTLCSLSALLDSPHTVLLQSWKDLVDPLFDDPGLSISMRAGILADTQRLWRADWLNIAPPNVVRGVVKILLDIIKPDGKASPEPTPVGPFTAVGDLMGTTNNTLVRIAGALRGGVGSMPGSSYLASYALSGGRLPAVPDEGRIATLVDMGFPRSACETALARTHNNLYVLATEFLFATPVLVQRAQDEEANRGTDPIFRSKEAPRSHLGTHEHGMAGNSAVAAVLGPGL
jgi:E3 ubiquitin-protein ligase HUWE1